MITHASEQETPEDRKERLYQELCSDINAMRRSPVVRDRWLDIANDAYWMRGIDNHDLLFTLRNNLPSAVRHGLDHVYYVYTVLDRECVDDVASVITPSTLAAADRVKSSRWGMPDKITAESDYDSQTRALVHYALTSPDCEAVTNLICEREPRNVDALVEIITESERLALPLKNGAL